MSRKLSDADEQLLSAPGTKAGRIQRACLKLLWQHEDDGAIPSNGRFLFYELTQAGILPKKYVDENGKEKARTPAQDVTDALTYLRDCGLIPWNWLTDESRSLTRNAHSRTVFERVFGAAQHTRINPWGDPAAAAAAL